ncbi:6-bladed beta-propeller [Cyclobacterium qasimii]|uniref:6-bladed beta-propeller protein n=2 Tax=Cyclobacterium qasimii TaxID=1350429 RepID=S7VK08_9BACT|nr:6-bladed beta-propeller [Cyclobacterium qasimii]EPR69837.1 hypothetical protein ADICYQ_1221 [Cyclobacterium qasimii M12-11B]GEO20486.1 hypothetical protein CQA01_10200 [Cyclobacterium qasimii]
MCKIRYYGVIIGILGIILVQCQTKEKEGETDKTPSFLIDNTSLLPFENIVSEIEFIPLVAPKDTLINLSCNVSDLVVNDKIYYASRCFKDLSIHSFDLAGNHLRSWNKKGEGPGEYPALHGLIVENNELYVSTGRGSILKYGLPEFDFKKEIKLGEYNFVPTESLISPESWLISSEPPNKEREKIFHVVDPESKDSKTLSILSLPYSGELNPGMIANMKDGKLLNIGLSDTIYSYQEAAVKPFITLNFDNKSIIPDDFELEGEAFVEKILLSQDYAFNTGLIDFSEGCLKLMAYGIEKNPLFDKGNLSTFPFYDVFISRSTGELKITKALLNVRNNSYSAGGYFYQVMQQTDWQRALDLGYFGKYEDMLLKSIEKLSDEEDPIILKFKIDF